MSLISDALNKAQQNRAEQVAFGTYAAGAYSRRPKPAIKVKSLTFIWANVAILAVFFAVALVYMRNRPDRVGAPASTAAPTLAASAPSRPFEAPAPSQVTTAPSPFTDLADSPIVPTAGKSTEYDLAGMTVMGKNTLLSIMRRSDKRSVWVPVGKSVGEITAVSYDPDQDRAVIRVNGRLHTVGMRDSGQAAE